MSDNVIIVLTGGTGSFGSSFIPFLLNKPEVRMIRIYSRDEHKQRILRQKYPTDRLSFYLGDVRDYPRLEQVMDGANWVVHAAALKQAPCGEVYPEEFIKTNIIGSLNVAHAAFKENLDKCLLISSDKAVEPINLYGATKMCAERVFLNLNNMKGTKKTNFSVVRYGNVVGTSGSFIELICKSKVTDVIPVTEFHSTRFLLTLDMAHKFVWDSLNKMNGGETFIPTGLKSSDINSILNALCPNNPTVWIGLRAGDKIHEKLCDGLVSNTAPRLSLQEIREYAGVGQSP